MKKTLVWFGAAFLAIGFAACGGGSKKEETTPVAPAGEGMMADAGMMAPEGTTPTTPPQAMTGNPCGAEKTAATGNPCSK
jgi:hypothetical protein